MGTLIYALPVLPGQADRVRRFQEEIEPLRADYDELNRQASVTRHEMYPQESQQGDLAITIMEADDLTSPALWRTMGETPYDLWWRAWNRDVHGFDPADMRPEDMRAGVLVFSNERQLTPT